MRYVADFETTTTEPARVWAWGIACIETEEFVYGEDIESFFDCIQNSNGNKNDTYYFHNLKFDVSYIFDYALKNGWSWCKKANNDKEFNTLISDRGVFYSTTFCFTHISKHGKETIKKITFLDSLKIISLPVKAIPKAFGLTREKLEIEYEAERNEGYKLTTEELEYLKNDCLIVRDALRQMFERGLDKMTAASNAINWFKKSTGKNFDRWFPELYECTDAPKLNVNLDINEHEAHVLYTDRLMRGAYKGGWTYVKEDIKGKDVGEGIVLDVNSLYPFVMKTFMMPFGVPLIENKLKTISGFPLYIVNFTAKFELKENRLPTIQIKNSRFFDDVEYLKSSEDEDVELTLTNVDYALMHEQYHVYDESINKVYYFRGSNNMFRDYVDYWGAIKVQAGREGNAGMKQIAKLMLNSLYGKFAVNPIVGSKRPVLIDNRVTYETEEQEYRSPVYLPCGIFITSWARNYTIRTAQSVYERFLYSDTDSIHLSGTEIPEGIRIDSNEFGAWDHEKTFSRARFIRAKRYIEEVNGNLEITCAGMPKDCYQYVTWDNFKNGAPPFPGKKIHKVVNGGAILQDTFFTLK